MPNKQNTLITILIYILLIIFTYLTFKFLVKNIILISIILPLFVLLIIYTFSNIKQQSKIPVNKKSVRYTMHCKSCNWEWMSNTADKAPTTCPNCREKEKLEIIGWRHVLMSEKKTNIDLRRYFK